MTENPLTNGKDVNIVTLVSIQAREPAMGAGAVTFGAHKIGMKSRKEQTMRLIDADALIARASQDSERLYLESVVRHTPSIDIVRCQDCKHWNGEDHWCNIRDSYGWDYKPDDFCSYGEREGE